MTRFSVSSPGMQRSVTGIIDLHHINFLMWNSYFQTNNGIFFSFLIPFLPLYPSFWASCRAQIWMLGLMLVPTKLGEVPVRCWARISEKFWQCSVVCDPHCSTETQCRGPRQRQRPSYHGSCLWKGCRSFCDYRFTKGTTGQRKRRTFFCNHSKHFFSLGTGNAYCLHYFTT